MKKQIDAKTKKLNEVLHQMLHLLCDTCEDMENQLFEPEITRKQLDEAIYILTFVLESYR